jgi:hypothetical protein
MKIAIDIPEHVLDDFQRTSFLTRDQRTDALLLRELVAFLIVENARDLPTAMRFSAHLAQRREAKTLEWQAKELRQKLLWKRDQRCSMTTDDQERANRMVDDWSKDKKDFHRVRQRMGEIVMTDMDLLRSGRPGIGAIRDGNIDLDAAYDLARRTHPETRDAIRASERKEREQRAAQRRGGEPEKARDTILRSMRELKERE